LRKCTDDVRQYSITNPKKNGKILAFNIYHKYEIYRAEIYVCDAKCNMNRNNEENPVLDLMQHDIYVLNEPETMPDAITRLRSVTSEKSPMFTMPQSVDYAQSPCSCGRYKRPQENHRIKKGYVF
jgi:hypothetical protein